ncbi:triose-phosphate isomerase [Shouchella patagoniensis]|uniref:triose-phosphate isomerase n=1 Tax=Shouchella patagoniensis TaxID=228576 RepID=UPI0009955AA1|nr:triose-phosphate isomerase [Shouchella patagoniensis]
MKPFWIGTNWKMTKTTKEGLAYVEKLKTFDKDARQAGLQLFVIPSFLSLPSIHPALNGTNIKLGAQNMHWAEQGAYTGEISASMLTEAGVQMIELGHSERRKYFNETDEQLNKKLKTAIHHGIQPLVCIGEDRDTKQAGESAVFNYLAQQIDRALHGIQEEDLSSLLLAYEPVWAIGEQGVPAEAAYIDRIHTFIRNHLRKHYRSVGDSIPLLYGGSVHLDNFHSYRALEHVNGLFVGRAAWDMDLFKQMLTELIQIKSDGGYTR